MMRVRDISGSDASESDDKEYESESESEDDAENEISDEHEDEDDDGGDDMVVVVVVVKVNFRKQPDENARSVHVPTNKTRFVALVVGALGEGDKGKGGLASLGLV